MADTPEQAPPPRELEAELKKTLRNVAAATLGVDLKQEGQPKWIENNITLEMDRLEGAHKLDIAENKIPFIENANNYIASQVAARDKALKKYTQTLKTKDSYKDIDDDDTLMKLAVKHNVGFSPTQIEERSKPSQLDAPSRLDNANPSVQGTVQGDLTRALANPNQEQVVKQCGNAILAVAGAGASIAFMSKDAEHANKKPMSTGKNTHDNNLQK